MTQNYYDCIKFTRLAAPGEHRGGFGTCGRRARGCTSPHQDPRPTPRAGNPRPGGGKRCTDSVSSLAAGNTSRANRRHPAPPASSCGRRLGLLGASRDSDNSTVREWIVAPNQDPPHKSGGGPAERRVGPDTRFSRHQALHTICTRSPPGTQGLRLTPDKEAHWTATRGMDPGTTGPRQTGTVPKEAVTDSTHRWRSPANHGPPLPGRRTTRCKDSPTGQPTGPPIQAAPT